MRSRFLPKIAALQTQTPRRDTPIPPHTERKGVRRIWHSQMLSSCLCSYDCFPASPPICADRRRRPRLNPPPPREDMLEEPRLLLLRALIPSYPLEPPPNASRFPPPLRDRSRLPMRSAPPIRPLPLVASRSLTGPASTRPIA